MINAPQSTDQLWHRGQPCPYDAVIDVRTPGEFAEDHIPGAINLPVLSDVERIEVGTIYRTFGAFPARKRGAALVSSNIGRHLQEFFADKGKEFRPMVYCWRGGQRSASLATVLAHVGWRVTVLHGGYKTYRAYVRRELETLPSQYTFQILAGATGTGKTRLLHALSARSAQVLDLERLACHRGSVLGGHGPQPSQKFFETMLLASLEQLNPHIPVWVEAESNRIGDVLLPPALWTQMRTAAGVELRVPAVGRVRHLLAEYSHFLFDANTLKHKLSQLVTRHSPRLIRTWNDMIDAGEWDTLVTSLLKVHYDPAYVTSARRCYPRITQTVDLAEVTPAAIDELAARLIAGSIRA